MAHRTPSALQNENFPIRIGKDVHPVKPAVRKPAKAGRRDRRALADLSNTCKPPVSGPSKPSAPREKSALRGPETIKNAPCDAFLSDEELKKCHEWANEGIELAPFTGSDLQKYQKKIDEERVEKKVRKVMSASQEWLNAKSVRVLPQKKEHNKDITDKKKMELEPETLPCPTTPPTSKGKEEIGHFLEHETDHLLFLQQPVALELKED